VGVLLAPAVNVKFKKVAIGCLASVMVVQVRLPLLATACWRHLE
jgi:hypothetical protein